MVIAKGYRGPVGGGVLEARGAESRGGLECLGKW